MKIAIPVSEKNLESEVYPSFGRAPYFLFHNTLTKETYYHDNKDVASQSGAGIRAAQVIVDNSAEALVTPHCGENAKGILCKSEVLIYKSDPGTAQQNIDALIDERLILLRDFNPGFHGYEK